MQHSTELRATKKKKQSAFHHKYKKHIKALLMCYLMSTVLQESGCTKKGKRQSLISSISLLNLMKQKSNQPQVCLSER